MIVKQHVSVVVRLDPTTQYSSILGKMFQNFEGICSALTVSVILVSNVAFEFADQLICAKDIAPKFRDKVKERLTKEVPNFFQAQLDNLHFLIAGVSIDAMNSFLHGEAMALSLKMS